MGTLTLIIVSSAIIAGLFVTVWQLARYAKGLRQVNEELVKIINKEIVRQLEEIEASPESKKAIGGVVRGK